jgi:nicotinamidase-related amidase
MKVLLAVLALAFAIPASANMNYTGLGALLRPADSVLLLIDHQAFQFADLHSHDPTLILNNVIALTKTAKAFNIPVVFTTVLADRGGKLNPGIQAIFPDLIPIDRTTINTWEDPKVVNKIASLGRKQLIIAGLWTELCVAMPVISALADGYEVFYVTDASGGKTKESHDMAVLRMLQAGAVPMCWMTVLCELQRDWARDTQSAVLDIFMQHGGGSGSAYMWETQLLSKTSAATSTGSSGV